MKENRAPSQSWMLRLPPAYPNGYVITHSDDTIGIYHFEHEGEYGQAVLMSRKDARLLAKRINQCLDATVKK